ncbi:GerAB/ArcD/ProY family transporter [Tissierella creatinophila]|uniref:Spore germination protein YndE n=1 Tax=Tissierella creatinophila DSM 6911 TaxID=1123403 RepID=A0A1U7M4N2_TISCR|nr:endospore germination permease [Tissierella creatinophila]OLS02273.1 spore germination protein YndE [Tissierella creatinophila DSM 6911]
MKNDLKISHIQLRALIISAVIGVGIISLPNDLANILEKDGWILIVLSALLIFPIIFMINHIFKINPGKDYFQIGEETLGKVIFTICKLLFLAYLIVYCSYEVAILSQLIKAFLLHITPVEIIIFLFVLTSVYISSMEIDIIARAGYFIYPIILIFAGIFFFISLPTADFSNVLPAFQSNFKNIPRGIVSTFFSFTGFEVLLFALPYVEDKKKALKSSMIALGIITFIYLLMFFTTLTQFYLKQLQGQNFSLVMIAKTVDLPGYFLQNLDGVVMAIWILVVFATFAPAFFGAGKILSNTFRTKSHKYFLLGLVPVIYYLALVPKDYIELQRDMLKILNILSFLSIVVIPFLIFIVGIIKRRIKA